MSFLTHSGAVPRRTPLATCLAVVLGSAAIFATSGDAFATWQHKHDFKHPARAHAATLPKTHLHQAAPDHHQAFLTQLQKHKKIAAAKAKNPNQPTATTAVTSCLDDGSAGTLRSVVAAANSGDTIDLSGLTCSTITLTTGAISTGLDDLTINGPGAAKLTIDGGQYDRVFLHYGNGTLTINKTTIANGYYKYGGGHYADGGCILTTGSLVLSDSAVTGCYAGGAYIAAGGGSYSFGTTALTRSTVSNSDTFGFAEYGNVGSTGGGVQAGGTITLTDSTITGNGAYGYAPNQDGYNFIRGGGIYSFSGASITRSTIDTNYAVYSGAGASLLNGTTTISNSTIANNYSYIGYGGGMLALSSSVSLGNSTIAGNYSYHAGGGVYAVFGPTDLESTIIASNTSGDTSNADFGYYGSYTPTGANNLIVSSTFAVPSGTLTADPQLQPLANNGGPTQTMALIAGSPAIDKGNNVAGLATDQRGTGFARVGGTVADIGAFELQVAVAPAAPPVPAPALSAWAQWLLAGAMALLGLGGFLRRKSASS